MSNVNEGVDTQWLLELLNECQLTQFYNSIKDDLQITHLAHFDFVVPEDLEKIGLSRPRIRQLMEHVKKKKAHQWRKNILSKLIGGGKQQIQNNSSSKKPYETTGNIQNPTSSKALTCLIHEKVIDGNVN